MTYDNAYVVLAKRLDEMPQGYPATEDGIELKLLEYLFSVEEAALASKLRVALESSSEVSQRIGFEPAQTYKLLKGMAKRGLITCGKTDNGLGFGLMPFVVGIYEMQAGKIDKEFATIFEEYYQRSFHQALSMQPSVHRVIPVQEAIQADMAIEPYESVSHILNQASSWGVLDCICRKQKALIGDPCEHPLDVCMVFSQVPQAFDNSSTISALTHEQATETLHRAAVAGLVHSVSNNQKGIWYVCNCCTCSCGVLRGLAEMGIANVIARSGFVNTVDEDMCMGCQDCLDACQFNALSFDNVARVDVRRCVGCGVCVLVCPEDAMKLVARSQADSITPPADEHAWMIARATSRGIDLNDIM
jgi:electron transport complex protein RnfB